MCHAHTHTQHEAIDEFNSFYSHWYSQSPKLQNWVECIYSAFVKFDDSYRTTLTEKRYPSKYTSKLYVENETKNNSRVYWRFALSVVLFCSLVNSDTKKLKKELFHHYKYEKWWKVKKKTSCYSSACSNRVCYIPCDNNQTYSAPTCD